MILKGEKDHRERRKKKKEETEDLAPNLASHCSLIPHVPHNYEADIKKEGERKKGERPVVACVRR